MGGTFSVHIWTSNPSHEKTINAGFDLIVELENKLTDFRDSPFNLINECAGKNPVVVDAETFSLIQMAQNFSQKTHGAFDITYATVGRLWRAARVTGVLPDEAEVQRLSKLIGYQKIQLDEKASTVFLPEKDLRIGLGGIGKGYAVDKLYDFLCSKGLVNFLIDGSGDVRVHSEEHAPRPWRLGIRNPFSADASKKIGYLALKNGSLATSGDYVNFIKADGLDRKYHHIINPLSGKPTEGIVSSTVLMPTALESDLHATLLMILGAQKGLHYLNAEKLTGLMVKSDGTVIMSEKAMQLMGELK